jgi:hypothetical protein
MEDVGIFTTILPILWPNGIFNGHWVHFVFLWYILWPFGIFFPRFGTLYREQSGNPVFDNALFFLFQPTRSR